MVVVNLVPGLVLVTGPSRSGKSRWAEYLVEQQSEVTYVATSAPRPKDALWLQRIVRHRERRPSHWKVVECGADLAGAMHTIPQTRPCRSMPWAASTLHLDLDADQWSKDDTLAASQRPATVVIVIEKRWGGSSDSDRRCFQTDKESWLKCSNVMPMPAGLLSRDVQLTCIPSSRCSSMTDQPLPPQVALFEPRIPPSSEHRPNLCGLRSSTVAD